ncbi:MAG: transcriptional regulator, winged helix family [Nocardioidaceae bacterium]|nr:transcriptional regulator, winged helix family [Nocardioidaceae bacterium]
MSGPALVLLDGVRWHGEPVPGERAQALLATLVLAAPHPVSVGGLVASVWDDDAPDHPEKALQVQVSRLRSRTGAEVVTRVGTGYQLGLRDDEVDALLLRRLLATAREAWTAGDLDVVRHVAAEAVGVPLSTREATGALADVQARAEADHQAAERLLGSVRLARGESAEALVLLEPALRRRPDDEGLLAEVLRAEAEVRGVPSALARYAAYDARVRDQLGAEPGESLRRLHAELLARDAPVREGLKYDAAPMVGRDGDVAAIRGLLARSRVVSIVGAGGLGKTRMAHLVGRLAQQPSVHVVELAGVTAPEGVLPEVGNALQVRESVAVRSGQIGLGRGTDLRARVAERLTGAPTLLVLDNCEHLIEAVADLVSFLIATTDTLTVLTTSRAPLGIAAEEVYLLPQLGLDDAHELFVRRARAARSGVRLDHEEVAGLVARLDGLPLAIELAAAKVRVMSVAEITRRLGDRFALLVGTDRSAPDRHRTLEAVIDWSWNLLRPEDQAVMRALAVFPDGFTLEGAEAVLGHDPLSAVAELVDQSLVVVLEEDAGLSYRFLETVREYGLGRLGKSGEEPAVRERLRAWARDVSRAAMARLYTPEQVAVMGEVRREAGNLSAIMRAALEAGDVETLVPTLDLLTGFWSIEGDHLTVLGVTRSALDVLLARPDVAVPGTTSLMTALLMNEAIFTGKVRPAGVEALQRMPPETGTRSSVQSQVLLAVFTAEGDPQRQLDTLETLCQDDDRQVATLALMWTCQALENAGDLAGARVAGERALALSDGRDGPWTRAMIQSQLSGLFTQFGDWEASRRYAEQAVPVMVALGAVEDDLQLRSVIALADLAEGRLDRARVALDAISRDERSRHTIGWNVGVVGQAELALAEGDVDRGLALYREAIASDRNRVPEGFDVDVDLTPWYLYGVAATVFAGALHGRREAVTDLAHDIRDKLPRTFSSEAITVDYPIVGCVLAAWGAFVLTDPTSDEAATERGLRAFALAEKFGYQRILPSMAWRNIERLAEEHAPGRLPTYLDEYAGRAPRDLGDEALSVVR